MRGVVTSAGRIRRSAFFMLLALAAEALSTLWRHPLSFYLFLGVGSLFLVLAVGSFLLSWFSPRSKEESWAPVTAIEERKEAVNE